MGKVNSIKPQIYNSLNSVPKGSRVIEAYERSIIEYYYVCRPQIPKESIIAPNLLRKFITEEKITEVWIFYPWLNMVVHTVNEDIYFKLRTARNRNIITWEQQQKFRDFKVGIVGLSVGSNALSSLVYTGGPKNLKIADFDIVEITNLNRIKASILDIGKNKAHVAAQNVWMIDPFAEIQIWDKGVSNDSLERFILENKIDVFIDTMDNLELKIAARLVCRKHKIPVVMITENGDGTIIDIERYDTDINLKIFHGRVDESEILEAVTYSRKEWLNLAMKIIDPNLLTKEMLSSIDLLGIKISGVPQIATSVNIGGAALAYSIRRIANSQPMTSGRYLVNLDGMVPMR